MGNGNLQRDGAQVNQKARPKNERQWQLPPIPDTGGEFWGCTRTFSVNHLAATPTSPRAARAPLHLSRCIAASDSNAAGWRDASGISQMSFSLLPPALPGSTTVPRPPPVPSCTDESRRSTSRRANPNIHSARDAAGGQLHARVIPSVISFFQGAAAARGAAGGANYSASRPHSRAHQQKKRLCLAG